MMGAGRGPVEIRRPSWFWWIVTWLLTALLAAVIPFIFSVASPFFFGDAGLYRSVVPTAAVIGPVGCLIALVLCRRIARRNGLSRRQVIANFVIAAVVLALLTTVVLAVVLGAAMIPASGYNIAILTGALVALIGAPVALATSVIVSLPTGILAALLGFAPKPA